MIRTIRDVEAEVLLAMRNVGTGATINQITLMVRSDSHERVEIAVMCLAARGELGITGDGRFSRAES